MIKLSSVRDYLEKMQIKTDSLQKETKSHGNYQFPVLISYESLRKYEAGSFMWHWHPEVEVTLITSGEMYYHINNETYTLSKNDVLFCNSGVMHSGNMKCNQNCEYISITFDPKVIYGYENSIIYTKYVKPIIQDFFLPSIHFDYSEEWHKEVLGIIKNLIEINYDKSEERELETVICIQQFWKLLFQHKPAFHQTDLDTNRDFERLRSIITYIELNYEGKITLDDISAKINLCKEECCRLFKRCMNISIFDYIIQFRIEKSAALLKETTASITEISQQVGFNDANHFAKLFRRQKNVSPTEFRKQNNKTAAAN